MRKPAEDIFELVRTLGSLVEHRIPGAMMGIQHKPKSVRNANKKRVRARKNKLRGVKKSKR